MNLMDQLDEEYAARYRADQHAAVLRSRGCPEDVIPTFLADREEQNRTLRSLPYNDGHPCCDPECLEIVPRGVLFCAEHQSEINERRRKARSRWRRLGALLKREM